MLRRLLRRLKSRKLNPKALAIELNQTQRTEQPHASYMAS